MSTKFRMVSMLIICAVYWGMISAFAMEPVYFEPVEMPDRIEAAVTYSHISGERTPMYYEPAMNARLLGEYFDGVSVGIIERVSDEWAFVDIHTFGAGGYGYMMIQDLAFGSETDPANKTTELYYANAQLTLGTHAMGQSGEMGPYAAGTEVELLGFSVSDNSGMDRPLSADTATWHVKIGDETGFLKDHDGYTLSKAYN